MQFKSTVLILPGLGNSGEGHWQTIWQQRFGFTRINQADWDTPICDDWVSTINNTIKTYDSHEVILVAHSLACTTISAWVKKYDGKVKAALLVALSDTEAESYPAGTTGFNPMHLNKLTFPSISVTSNNDFYVTPERAAYFAQCWGSELINIGDAGHINVASGYGEWNEGLELLHRLDNL